MKKLLLWDIDGTLLNSGGAGRRAMESAINKTFSIDVSLETIDFNGRTDQNILSQFFNKFEFADSEESRLELCDLYYEQLLIEIPQGEGMILPGVIEVVETVHRRDDLNQGLLTGNFERGAQVKLEHFNLWHYFEFGAFGEESEDRNELGPRALERAKVSSGYNYSPEQVYVIGDTAHDIACGKALGANTIGVATGWTKADDLAVHNPTALFTDLSGVEEFFQILDN